MDDYKRRREIEEDAFHEGMDWPHAVGIIAALFLIAWSMDHIERKVEQNAAPQGVEGQAAYVRDSAPAVAAPVLPLSHPLCGPEREQIVRQWGGGYPPVNACINADLTNRGKK